MVTVDTVMTVLVVMMRMEVTMSMPHRCQTLRGPQISELLGYIPPQLFYCRDFFISAKVSYLMVSVRNGAEEAGGQKFLSTNWFVDSSFPSQRHPGGSVII